MRRRRSLRDPAAVRSRVVSWTIQDRSVIVTGGNSGIGRATATALASAGAQVTIMCRNAARGARAAAEISNEATSEVACITVDLADRSSIEDAAATYLSRGHGPSVLINNAGAVFGKRQVNDEGFELTLATNHLGPFLLTHLLMDAIVRSAPSRVINVASSGHGWAKRGIRYDDPNLAGRYRLQEAYGQSKLANILHARALADRFGVEGVSAYSVHPGLAQTDIGRGGESRLVSAAYRIGRWRLPSPDAAADTVVWLATTPIPPEPNGGYFEQRRLARSSRWAREPTGPDRLWDMSTELLRLPEDRLQR